MKHQTSPHPNSRLLKTMYQCLCLVLALAVTLGMAGQQAVPAAAQDYNVSVSIEGDGSVILLDQENSQELTQAQSLIQIEEGRPYSVQALPASESRLVSMTVNGQEAGQEAVDLTAGASLTVIRAVFEAIEEPSSSQEAPASSQDEPEASNEDAKEALPYPELESEDVLETEDLTALAEAEKISESAFNSLSSRRTLRSVSSLEEASVSTGDNEIESFSATWLSPELTTGLMTVKPEDNKPFSVRMRLSGSLSGQEPYEAGDVNITIPKTIWANRLGKPVGVMNFSVPQAPDTRGVFAYSETEDAYVLTNTRALAAASAFYFEFTLSGLTPSDIADLASGYQSDPFYGILSITSANGETVQKKSNELVADLDTYEKVNKALGYGNVVSRTWNENWPAKMKPENPEDYYYALWYVYADRTGNQTYELILDAQATDKYQGEVLGMESGQNTAKGDTITLAQNEYLKDGYGYYTYIYTAYPKTAFEKEGTYPISISAQYTLIPQDNPEEQTKAKVDLKNSIVISEFKAPNPEPQKATRFSVSKTGAGYSNSTVYGFAVNQLLNNEEVDLEYIIQTTAFGYPYTLEGEAGKPENYGKQSYTVTMQDEDLFFNEKINGSFSSQALLQDASQYEFKELLVKEPTVYLYQQYEVSAYGRTEVPAGLTRQDIPAGSYGYMVTNDASYYPDLQVYDTSSGSRVLMATISWNGNSQAYNGARLEGRKVIFPSGVTKYETEYTTASPGVEWEIRPVITLKPERSIVEQLQKLSESETAPSTTLANAAYLHVKTQSWEDDIFSAQTVKDYSHIKQHIGVNTLSSVQTAAGIEKSVTTQNDPVNRVVNLEYTVNVTEQSNLQSLNTYVQAQESGALRELKQGVFYDLLPLGVEIDIQSIQLRENDTIRDVQLERNYKGSGRTLVIVKADLTPEVELKTGETLGDLKGYRDILRLTYKATYTWENLQDLGPELDNRVVFESENGPLGSLEGFQGEYNSDPLQKRNKSTASALKGAESLLTDLPSDNEDPSFIYGVNTHTVVADITALSSLTKTVAVNQDGLYADGLGNYPLDVYEKGSYTYRIRFENVSETTTQNLVFYDSLESWTDVDEEDQNDIRWKGTLKSLNLSQLKSAGADAKVYWSDQELGLYEAGDTSDNDLTNGKWKPLTDSTDLSQVRSIAVDCTKALDGSNFLLLSGQSLTFYMHMQAPEYQEGHAYNAASVILQQKGNSQSELIFNEYTKVGLKEYSIEALKVWQDAGNQDGIRPESVSVSLKRNGRKVASAVLSEDNQWKTVFEKLEYASENGTPYWYTLEEDSVPDGYKASIARKTDEQGQAQIVLTNTHIPETLSVSGTKTWMQDSEDVRPQSVTVHLLCNGVRTATQKVSAKTGWKYSFDNLPKYDSGKELEYSLREEYVPGYTTLIEDGQIVNTYDPYGTLKLTKKVRNETEVSADQEFTFLLTITQADGVTPVSHTYDYTTSDGRKGTISNGQTLTLKKDQSAEVYKVDSDCLYTWEEQKAEGFTLLSSSNSTGTIQAGQTSEAVFVNDYTAIGKAYVKAVKVVENQDLKAGTFAFVLKNEQGETVKMAYAKKDGSVSFAALNFSGQDHGKTFVYTLEELVQDLPGYTFDQRKITVRIMPTDNGDGTMNCSVQYLEEGEGVQPVFVNVYKASGSTRLSAWKQLIGRDLQEQEFTFELVHQDEVVSQAQNDVNGTVQFEALEYTEQDIGKTFVYTVREKAGEDATVQYSIQEFSYKVTVIDNHDGTLSIEQEKGQEDLPVFVNRLQTGSVSVSKEVEGEKEPGKEFRFKIRFTGPPGSRFDESIEFERSRIKLPSIVIQLLPNNGHPSPAQP